MNDRSWAGARNTGRTTRMLQAAIRAAAEDNRAVYVIAADYSHQYCLRNQANMLAQQSYGIDVEQLGIKFETYWSLPGYDWETGGRLTGAHPNCIVFEDHYAIESRIERIMQRLHQWDAVEVPA